MFYTKEYKKFENSFKTHDINVILALITTKSGVSLKFIYNLRTNKVVRIENNEKVNPLL